jgi:hypothetical protein
MQQMNDSSATQPYQNHQGRKDQGLSFVLEVASPPRRSKLGLKMQGGVPSFGLWPPNTGCRSPEQNLQQNQVLASCEHFRCTKRFSLSPT